MVKNASISIVPIDYENIDNDLSILNHDLAVGFANRNTHKASSFFKISKKSDIAYLNIALASIEASGFWEQKHTSISANTNRNVGFSIQGRARITGVHKTRQIFFLQKSLGTFYSANLSSSGDFHFRNVIIDKNNPINFVVKLGKKELENPKIEFDITPEVLNDSIPRWVLKKYAQVGSGIVSKDVEKRIISGEDEQLDEVVIIGKIEEEPSRNTDLGVFFESEKIDEAALKKRKNLSNYVRSLGFKVFPDPDIIGNFIIQGRDFLDNSPIVYVDGFQTNQSIKDEALDSVDEVYFEHSGVEGSNGGTIYIYLRFDSLKDRNKIITQELEPELGFQFSSTYENPIIFQSFTNSLKKIAAVHWEPNIQFDINNKVTIGFPSFGLEGIKYVVNGITSKEESLYQEGEILFDE